MLKARKTLKQIRNHTIRLIFQSLGLLITQFSDILRKTLTQLIT